jgi:hypothetical protein
MQGSGITAAMMMAACRLPPRCGAFLVHRDGVHVEADRAAGGVPTMRQLTWGLLAVLAVIVAAGLHWSLPSREIVRIVNTELQSRTMEERVDGGQTVTRTVDVRYIHAITPDGKPLVYRNEDTGFGWPPFFKFDSATLAAEAEDAQSTDTTTRWVVMTRYGWRMDMMSWFPNAVALRPAVGPDEGLFPWFNIVILTVLGAAVLLLWARGRRLLYRAHKPQTAAIEGDGAPGGGQDDRAAPSRPVP